MNNTAHTYNDTILPSTYEFKDTVVNVNSNITREIVNEIIEREDCPCYKICFTCC